MSTTKLETLSLSELAKMYNELAKKADKPEVKKFSDKKSAVRRVKALANDVKPAKASTPRKPRGMRFVFRPEATIRDTKGTIKSKSDDTRTLRTRAVALLTGKGATFKAVEATVEKFDQDRGKKSVNIERRAYELIRLVHYYLGYGLKQVDDTIIAYTDNAEA